MLLLSEIDQLLCPLSNYLMCYDWVEDGGHSLCAFIDCGQHGILLPS